MHLAKALTFFAAAAFSTLVLAWGNEGHQTIALIAEAELNPTTRAEIQQLLALEGPQTMADTASWADQIRGSEPGLVSHAVRIPFNVTQYDAERDCSRKGRCVVLGIESSSATLADVDAPAQERLRALKFLIHFVGDIHQPLHAIKQTGQMQAQWGKRTWTLHKIWDTILVRSLKSPPAELARDLLRDPAYAHVQQGSPAEWAMESHDIARHFIYHDDKSFARTKESLTLPDDYQQQAAPIVKERLAFAGIRLGRLLNQLLSAPARHS